MKNKLVIVAGMLVGMLCFALSVNATASITPSTLGSAISAGTASSGGTGAFTALSGPILQEGVKGDVKSGTLTLTAPAGFEFDASSGATVTVTSNGSNPATNINHLSSGSTIPTTTTSSQISFIITSQSTSARNTLTWGNVRVRPTSATPLASGNITLSSTNSIVGVTLPANVGALTEIPVPATLSSIAITTPANKLSYTVGDSLDISGLVVTGTYSDSSTQSEIITDANISGFDSSTPSAGQVLTITDGAQTATYTVDILAPVSSGGGISVISDTTALASAIALAQNDYASAIEGTIPGEYPLASKAVLLSAIASASTLTSASAQSDIDTATANLNTARTLFEASVVPVPIFVPPVVITMPTAIPAGGNYTSVQNVVLTASVPNIFYTLDGTIPTCATGTQYANPIPVSASETIQAVACDTNNNSSDVASFPYVISIPIVVNVPVTTTVTSTSGGAHGVLPIPTPIPTTVDTNVGVSSNLSNPLINTPNSGSTSSPTTKLKTIYTSPIPASAPDTLQAIPPTINTAPIIPDYSLSASVANAPVVLSPKVALAMHKIKIGIKHFFQNPFSVF